MSSRNESGLSGSLAILMLGGILMCLLSACDPRLVGRLSIEDYFFENRTYNEGGIRIERLEQLPGEIDPRSFVFDPDYYRTVRIHYNGGRIIQRMSEGCPDTADTTIEIVNTRTGKRLGLADLGNFRYVTHDFDDDGNEDLLFSNEYACELRVEYYVVMFDARREN